MTDSGTPILPLTATQAADDAVALGKITNGTYAIEVADRASNVAANLDALNAGTRISSITLTDVEQPILSLTAAQALGDTAALAKISNANYGVNVTDTAANILANSNALQADPNVVSISVSDSASDVIANDGALSSGSGITSVNVVDTAEDVSANFDALGGLSDLSSITLTDSGTPTLTLTADQASDSPLFTLISNSNYTVSVSDTAANVSDDFDFLNQSGHLSSITLTDSGTPTLVLTATQAIDDTATLSTITNPAYSVAIQDTAADVSQYLTALNSDPKLSSITLTDSGTPTLALNIAQTLGDTTALGAITNSTYAIAVTDMVANILGNSAALDADSNVSAVTVADTAANVVSNVAALVADRQVSAVVVTDNTADVLENLATLESGALTNVQFDIVDTAANVAANLDALESIPNLSSITLTDSGVPTLILTAAQALNDTAALGKIASSYNVAVVDTAANIVATGYSLDLWSVTVSDTAADILAQTAALSTYWFLSAVNVVDSASDVAANFDALNADTLITSITLTGDGAPTLYLTSAQANSDTTALSKITNTSYSVVVIESCSVAQFLADQNSLDALSEGFAISDTAANVAANFDALNADTHLTAITLSDDGPLTLTAAQALNDTAALGKITNAGASIAIADTAANISASFDTLNADANINSITLTDDGTPTLHLTLIQAEFRHDSAEQDYQRFIFTRDRRSL